MSDKKQIEEIKELAIDILEEFTNCYSAVDEEVVAEMIYDAGYRKRSDWISVENPPQTYMDEYGELIPFLVCCNGTVYPFRAVYDGKNWGDGIGVLKVTHWMPLPEPPEGE